CAGLKSIDESEERPLAYYDVNVGSALSLIEVMGEAGVATIVFTSSAAVYGQPAVLPISEETPAAPQNVYGRTKRVIEDFWRDHAECRHGPRSIGLRNHRGVRARMRTARRPVKRSTARRRCGDIDRCDQARARRTRVARNTHARRDLRRRMEVAEKRRPAVAG